MNASLLPVLVFALSLAAILCSRSPRREWTEWLQKLPPPPFDARTGAEAPAASTPPAKAAASISTPAPAPAPAPPAAAPAPAPAPSAAAGAAAATRQCDLYSSGSWVRDESRLTFQPSVCPFVDPAFRCQENGRPDSDYLKWRWQPRDCELPRFNATDMLVRLRHKQVLFVGDSLGRNQWESLVCMLYQGVPNRNHVFDLHHKKVTKSIASYSLNFRDYDVQVRFARSNFLVLDKSQAANMDPDELWLDQPDDSRNGQWKADILVFNSGHWWNHAKIIQGCSFVEGNNSTTSMDVLVAFEKAMVTWSRWVDTHVTNATRVYFRGFSPNHFRGGQWNSGGSCSNFTQPQDGAEEFVAEKKVEIMERVIRNMKTPVTLLNITRLTDYRIDGHVGRWGSPPGASQKSRDCSHWCLPGVPDTWNEILYASLLLQ